MPSSESHTIVPSSGALDEAVTGRFDGVIFSMPRMTARELARTIDALVSGADKKKAAEALDALVKADDPRLCKVPVMDAMVRAAQTLKAPRFAGVVKDKIDKERIRIANPAAFAATAEAAAKLKPAEAGGGKKKATRKKKTGDD